MPSELEQIVSHIRSTCKIQPEIAIVLGSGLGSFADKMQNATRFATDSLPGYPKSTVEGHKGQIVLGRLSNKHVLCFQGRIHLYEGYSVDEILTPIRLAAKLGAQLLILTNASGGINPQLQPGTLMLITDQIDFQFRRKPIDGSAISEASERTRSTWSLRGSLYSQTLIDIAISAGLSENVHLFPGVLGAMLGPTYETPAEIRMMKDMGADAVCMSTVAEAAEAVRLGMDVLGISCITNRAAGLPGSSLDHKDVIKVAATIKSKFENLLYKIVKLI